MAVNAGQSRKEEKKKNIIRLNKQTEVKKPAADARGTIEPQDIIFALDIGTRTVVGIVGVPEGNKFKVIASEVVEHKNRAMLDGQIHNIGQVAEVAGEVKGRLEKKLGFALTKVAIAAAGRVLRTCEITVHRDTDSSKEIDRATVGSIEMEGIQMAQLKLDDEMSQEEKTQFYCVGYSVINYYLNGYIISSLEGHKAKKIGVDILATFLPHIVVDSLYTVMNKIGLEVVSLTLEPIAAINVTIPKDLRLLNLALVDIGAGTSDIALTKDGSVIAYGMAPIAGDEITEKIAQNYLVDFITAEKIKISLSSSNDKVSFTDILGKKHTVDIEDVRNAVNPSILFLAETISGKILEYNKKAPNAIFLIGGGSRIPGLTDMIADSLKIPRERVAVRGRDIIQNVKFNGRKLSGPESVTPVGIAVTAMIQRGQDFLEVTVNESKIRLFNSRRMTVADALILMGFNPGQLIGRSGKSLSFELNGVKKTIRGEYGRAAEIFVNGMPGNLETVLKHDDYIKINPAENGRDAEIKAGDVMSMSAGRVYLNGAATDIASKVYINQKPAGRESIICEGDAVQVSCIKTLSDLIEFYEMDKDGYDFSVNGQKEEMHYILKDDDAVEVIKKSENKAEVFDLTNAFSVTINGKSTLLPDKKSQYIFVDIFNYIEFDLSKPQGSIALKLNGNQAAFTDKIESGDIIDIYWEK
ncbi:cell division protein FtsA [Anaerobacterium chartisolvens]|uniref:Chaperone protein DnaK n=1 Tax=Anaerobacterium chartisolvens TaxID=1297424 RepID=A0A369AUB3_9FIRM|nr:cell division FtsA domain-containing protein [Anaerobacterium chartisolvens]RCX12972.1 cell division protein FtsA [Anaerobacterium chartisolvens]